jgi:SAM-dependent methyltransferase
VSDAPVIHWEESGAARVALWHAAGDAPPPRAVILVDDRLTADQAYGAACQGTGLLWRGDFQNARQMLLALGRRADRDPRRRPRPGSPADAFSQYRQGRAQRARTLNALLVPLDGGYRIPLARAPDVRQACSEAWGTAEGECVAPLRTLLGLIGAREWRVRGLEIAAAGGRVHPHYGVFAPVRHEYVDLVAAAPLPLAAASASGVDFDIGTGTGVLAAVLARRGVPQVVATDIDERALACANDNIVRLGLQGTIRVERADLYPPGRAALVVCNPPWLPARPASSLERGIYDPESHMLRGFLRGLATHLAPDGEGWLILSDLAEHLGLRTREELLGAFEAAHVRVVGRDEARPRHPRASDATDPLHAARAAEMTSLWRLAPDPR